MKRLVKLLVIAFSVVTVFSLNACTITTYMTNLSVYSNPFVEGKYIMSGSNHRYVDKKDESPTRHELELLFKDVTLEMNYISDEEYEAAGGVNVVEDASSERVHDHYTFNIYGKTLSGEEVTFTVKDLKPYMLSQNSYSGKVTYVLNGQEESRNIGVHPYYGTIDKPNLAIKVYFFESDDKHAVYDFEFSLAEEESESVA